MKIDIIKTLSAVGIGIFAGWGFSALAQNEADSLPVGLVAGVEIALLCMGLFGIDYTEYPRTGAMLRAACVLGLFALLVMNAVYAFCGVNASFFVLNGILSLVLLVTAASVYKCKQ